MRGFKLPLGPLVLALVFLALALLIARLPMPPLTGATVRSDTGYDFIVEERLTESKAMDIGLQHSPRSLAISADIEGRGTALVYLETDRGPKKVFVVEGDASAPIERKRVLRYACKETCAGLTNDQIISLQVIVRGATLVLHNISYTTGSTPTGAAVVDGFGNEIGIVPQWVYGALQILLTVLTVLLLVLGPIRKQNKGEKPAAASIVGIMAIATATALLALFDLYNNNYLSSVVLGVTMACALTLDIMLFRGNAPAAYVGYKLPVFEADKTQPDERLIRERLELIRRRLRQ